MASLQNTYPLPNNETLGNNVGRFDNKWSIVMLLDLIITAILCICTHSY